MKEKRKNITINYSNKKTNGIPASVLKWIAIITMLIDHVGATLLKHYKFAYPELESISILYRIFRNIGRISFPIFIFLLTEGFYYTKSKKKYLLRMLAFSLISEIPFDLAFYHQTFYFSKQNVFFTLTLGLLAIYLINFIDKKWTKNSYAEVMVKGYLKVLVVALSNLAAIFLKTDYNYSGVSAIIIMFCVKKYLEAPLRFYFGNSGQTKTDKNRNVSVINKPRDSMNRMLNIIAFIPACLMLLTSSLTEAFALIDVPLIYAYNGKRGKQMKYFFYLFYPVHLLLLWLIMKGLHFF